MSLSVADSSGSEMLRRRIAWLCHLLRIAVGLYALWAFYLTAVFWSDRAAPLRGFGSALDRPIGEVGTLQHVASAILAFASWGVVALTCLVAWRLFTGYLKGSIFTTDAARRLRFLAVLGLGAIAFDLVARAFIASILTEEPGSVAVFLMRLARVDDLLLSLLLGGLLAMAHIFAVAAEISDEYAQIV